MMRRAVRNLAVLSLLAVLSGGASCVSGDGGGGGYDGGNAGGYGRDDSYSSDRPSRIPRNADVVKQDVGKLRWRADLDGTVYVYDKGKDVIRYSGPVRRGDNVMVDPGDDRVTVGGATVSTENLERDGLHQIYFATDRDRAGRDSEYGRESGDDRPTPTESYGNALPADAKRLARGRDGVTLSDTPRSGTVYVYDESNRAVLARLPVRRGQSVAVAPSEGMVYVDGTAFKRLKVSKGSMLNLYFSGR